MVLKIMSGLSQTRTGTAGRSGLCLRAEFGRDALEGVADGVDGMVVSVRVAADPLAGTGLFILIGAELFISMTMVRRWSHFIPYSTLLGPLTASFALTPRLR